MSDEAAPAKRGRKANAEKIEKVEKEKAEPKKRARKVLTKHLKKMHQHFITFVFSRDRRRNPKQKETMTAQRP